MSSPSIADLVVVGAGILGLAHAWAAARAGMSVTVVERGDAARGASVRNFGMLATIAQPPGRALERAKRSQELLAGVATAAGVPLSQPGCVIAARTGEEEAVLAAHAGRASGTEFLPPDRLREICPLLRAEGLLGGLWAPGVRKIDQRTAPARIAAWLAREHGVSFRFGTAVEGVALPEVATSAGTIQARRVVVCGGDDFATLFPDAFAGAGIERCQLQMLRTEPQPEARRLGPFVLGGLSVARYAAFAEVPGISALRARLARDWPLQLEHGIHLIAAPEADGSVTIGDSHRYGRDVPAPHDARIDALMLDYLSKMLVLDRPAPSERWLGHYAHAEGIEVFRATPAPGVTLVTATDGQGLTHGFVLAEETLAMIG